MRDKKYFVWASIITFFWLFSIVVFILIKADGTTFNNLKLNEIGDFLAGLFAPVGFIWFVAAFMQQGEELRLSRMEMNNSVDQFRKQTESLEQTYELEKDKVAMANWTRIYNEMNSILSAFIFKFSKDLGKDNSAARKVVEKNWEQYSFGDKNTFIRTVSFFCNSDNRISLNSYISNNEDKIKRFLSLSRELRILVQPDENDYSFLIPEELEVIENYFKNKTI